MDVEILSRVQFALTAAFHFLFPPLTIGLGIVLVVLETIWMRTKDRWYHEAGRFWTKVFAINFAPGRRERHRDGVPVRHELGRLQPLRRRRVRLARSRRKGSSRSSSSRASSRSSSSDGIGWARGSTTSRRGWSSLGSIFSVGLDRDRELAGCTRPRGSRSCRRGRRGVDGVRAEIVDFWAMVFNPVDDGAAVARLERRRSRSAGSSDVSVCAYYMLKGRFGEFTRRCMPVGDRRRDLPARCLDGSPATSRPAASRSTSPRSSRRSRASSRPARRGSTCSGSPTPRSRRSATGSKIPHLLSWILYFDADARVTGLDAFPPEDRPPLMIPFVGFHLMVGLATFMLLAISLAAWFAWRGTLASKRWLLRILVPAIAAPMLAVQDGLVRRGGRQAALHRLPGGRRRRADAGPPHLRRPETSTVGRRAGRRIDASCSG